MKTRNQLLTVLFLLFVSLSLYSQQNIDVLILNKNYEKALQEIDSEISRNPGAELYLKQGLIYNRIQSYQEALKAYSSALQLKPGDSEILGEIAENLSVLGNSADAIKFFHKAVKADTTDLVLAGKLGRVYINLKEYKNAYKTFEKIYAKDSVNVYWNKQFAYCAFRVFKPEQACSLYEKVLLANPRDYGSYTNLIHSYNWKKQGNEIMSTIDKGLKQFPEDAGLILERANFFYKTKRYGPAMSSYSKYIDIEKKPHWDILMNYGISTYFAGYYKKAFDQFGEMMLLNPNDPLVMYYQSLCYKKQKNFEEAEKMMRWAIEATVPNYVSEMYHHLGQICGQQRKFKESVEALEKAFELEPKKTELLFEMATTYEEFNSNKTMALNYYRLYLKEIDEGGKNVNYALDRITRIKEDLFFEE